MGRRDGRKIENINRRAAEIAERNFRSAPIGRWRVEQKLCYIGRTRWNINELTGKVITAAIEVHKHLGPGLLESAYEECLCYELNCRNVAYERQKPLPLRYKQVELDCGYRLDIIVGNTVIVELKTCERIEPIHEAQLLTYLRLSGLKVGLILNFNVPVLKEGI